MVVWNGGLTPALGPVREDASMQAVSLEALEKRPGELERIVAPHGSALVAFSGGVDSSLALAVAARTLPKGKVLAVTSNNETYLPSELDLARDFVASLGDRKSTRLNSSHANISYAVFCLKKKKTTRTFNTYTIDNQLMS